MTGTFKGFLLTKLAAHMKKKWYEGIRMICDVLCIAFWHNWLISNAVVKFSILIYVTCISLYESMQEAKNQEIWITNLLIRSSVRQVESIISNIELNSEECGCNNCFPVERLICQYTRITLDCMKCIIYWARDVTMPCSVSKEIILRSAKILSPWKVFNNGKPSSPHPSPLFCLIFQVT